jgi:hypothetical protein
MAVSPKFVELLNELKSLHERKNSAYAGASSDPFKNFRYAELFGISAFKGCMVRMSDKFIRIANLSQNPDADKVGENIVDTLMDLAAYSLIAICLYEENNKK